MSPRTASGADLARSHLIGAGGAGMSAIGRILLDTGGAVSGSDAKGSHVLTGLVARGAKVEIGHRAGNLDLLPDGPTAVVISSAIRPDNPEIVEALRRGIPVVRRADALAALLADHRSVCIAGTHGKTSTTSMLTVALLSAGLDPSFAIGGELNESGSGAHAGTGDIFVAEADESDGSFLAFAPHGAVITTIEPDHLDHYGTAAAYRAAFGDFVDRIAPGGFLVAGHDDPGVAELLATLPPGAGPARILRYGRSRGSDVHIGEYRPDGHGGRATVALADGDPIELTVAVPGEHMIFNATAALAAGIALGVAADAMVAGLAGYSGVRRRFEFKGRAAGVAVYDDYAHHPTEIAATIAAARSVSGSSGGRLIVIFQPHLYSRTRAFVADFGRALAGADEVVVLDVYGAREDPQPGVTGALVAAAIPAGRAAVQYVPSLPDAVTAVLPLVSAGDVVLTMGAGDVTTIGPRLVAALRAAERTGGSAGSAGPQRSGWSGPAASATDRPGEAR